MNEYGGSYNFKINKKQSPTAWIDILLLLIGENIEGWMKNTVFGVSVSSRQNADNYQIWTAHNNKNIQDNVIRTKLEELLRPADIQSFYFKSKLHIIYFILVLLTPKKCTRHMQIFKNLLHLMFINHVIWLLVYQDQ